MILTWSLSFWNPSQVLIFNYWDDDNITMMCRVRFTLHIHMFCFAILSVTRRLLVTGMTKITSKSACVFLVETGKSSLTFVTGKELGTNSHTFYKKLDTHIFILTFFVFIELQHESIVKISSKVTTAFWTFASQPEFEREDRTKRWWRSFWPAHSNHTNILLTKKMDRQHFLTFETWWHECFQLRHGKMIPTKKWSKYIVVMSDQDRMISHHIRIDIWTAVCFCREHDIERVDWTNIFIITCHFVQRVSKSDLMIVLYGNNEYGDSKLNCRILIDR